MRLHELAGKAPIFISTAAPHDVFYMESVVASHPHYPVCLENLSAVRQFLPQPRGRGAEIFSRVTRPASSLPVFKPS